MQPTAAMSSPAALRNRQPILTVLQQVLPQAGNVLEIASGSGEHAVYFAENMPALIWQPSDPSDQAVASIQAHQALANLPNLQPALQLDACQSSTWPNMQTDAILCINMVHISPWAATIGLFQGAAKLLSAGAPLILYGPYKEADVALAPSNAAFDADLKRRNPAWGLRDTADMLALATEYGFKGPQRVEMPANNLMLIFHKS